MCKLQQGTWWILHSNWYIHRILWRYQWEVSLLCACIEYLLIILVAAALLRVLSLSTRVLSSSTIQVSWTQSEQDCFDFTPFIASCTPALQINVGVSANAVVLESDTTVANITSLDPDTTHNCSVTSQLRGNDNLVTIYGTQLATTYPKCEQLKVVFLP